MNHSLAKSLFAEPFETLRDDVISWGFDEIPEESFYGKNSREIDIHVTVINGIRDNFEKVYRTICNQKSFECKLGNLSLFQANKNFDVLFIEVNSPELISINKTLKKTVNIESYHSQYVPHITIGYLKKDKGIKYINNSFFNKEKFVVNDLYFSSKIGSKTLIELGKIWKNQDGPVSWKF